MLLTHIQYTQSEVEAGILVPLRSLLSLSILRRAIESSLMAPETMTVFCYKEITLTVTCLIKTQTDLQENETESWSVQRVTVYIHVLTSFMLKTMLHFERTHRNTHNTAQYSLVRYLVGKNPWTLIIVSYHYYRQVFNTEAQLLPLFLCRKEEDVFTDRQARSWKLFLQCHLTWWSLPVCVFTALLTAASAGDLSMVKRIHTQTNTDAHRLSRNV